MLCASVWLRMATGLKSERADPGVTAHLCRLQGEAFVECMSVYDENIATINIYPPRIQNKHGGRRSLERLENLCRVRVGYKCMVKV